MKFKNLVAFAICLNFALTMISSTVNASSFENAPAPAAKFTMSELAGKTIYSSAAPRTNPFGFIGSLTFHADGTVSETINMTSANPSTASKILTGTYMIDNAGVLTIVNQVRTEKYWKTTAGPDKYNSIFTGTNIGSVNCRWFFDQNNAAKQALAFSHGRGVPLK